jgi:hypothetical protein
LGRGVGWEPRNKIATAATRTLIKDVKVTCHLFTPGRFRGFSHSALKMVKKDAVVSEFENVGVSNLSEATLAKCELILLRSLLFFSRISTSESPAARVTLTLMQLVALSHAVPAFARFCPFSALCFVFLLI